MKTTLTTEQVIGRLLADKNANWTPAGARALAEYLEDYEYNAGELELDIVAIRCDFTEYENFAECCADYGIDNFNDIRKRTLVIEFDGGIIIQDF